MKWFLWGLECFAELWPALSAKPFFKIRSIFSIPEAVSEWILN